MHWVCVPQVPGFVLAPSTTTTAKATLGPYPFYKSGVERSDPSYWPNGTFWLVESAGQARLPY